MTDRSALTCVTLSGVPLRLELQWPFRRSTSGVDWYVMHGTAWVADGGPLHAELAVTMTETIAAALPSLERDSAETLIVNAVRKTVDSSQIAFLKSGKRMPVQVSSRFFSFVTRRVQFGRQAEADVAELLKRKVYWFGAGPDPPRPVRVVEAGDAEYVGMAAEELRAIARTLAERGYFRLQGEEAVPEPALLAEAEIIRAARDAGVALGAAAAKVGE